MILTANDVKKYLGLDVDTETNNVIINMTIPAVHDRIFSMINTLFIDKDRYVSGDATVFSKENSTITFPSGTDPTTEDITAGSDFVIANSGRNDGVYKAKSISSNVITVEDLDELIDETSKYAVYAFPCAIPKGLRLIAAKMVAHNLQLAGVLDRVVASESIGDYSVTYINGRDSKDNTISYSADIEKELKDYIQPGFFPSFS